MNVMIYVTHTMARGLYNGPTYSMSKMCVLGASAGMSFDDLVESYISLIYCLDLGYC